MTKSKVTYRIARRAGNQGARPPVGRQAGVEKYATGSGTVSIPSKHPPRHKKSTSHPQKDRNTIFRKEKRNQNRFRIGTINVQTAKEDIKLAEYVLHAKNIKQDVCCFQETHRTGNGNIEYDDPVLKGWKVIYSGFKRRSQAGVGVALAPRVTLVDVIYVEDGRIMCVCIIVNGIKLTVFCCYAPTDTKSYAEQQKIAFYQSLTKAMKNVKKEHPGFKVIFGGDFNATIGKESEQNWKCIGNSNDVESTSENRTRLLKFSTKQDLYLMNSRFGYKEIHRWSFYSNLGYK